jgi:propanediol dehydratase small subunit
MGERRLTAADYPIAEKRPELVRGPRGKRLDEVTLDAVVSGEATLEDLRITPEALKLQGEIARAAGRPMLAKNFDRASELVQVPQDVIMQVYELLRPGRAKDKAPLLEAARTLREKFQAGRMAAFVEEAAAIYERRGLFRRRF